VLHILKECISKIAVLVIASSGVNAVGNFLDTVSISIKEMESSYSFGELISAKTQFSIKFDGVSFCGSFHDNRDTLIYLIPSGISKSSTSKSSCKYDINSCQVLADTSHQLALTDIGAPLLFQDHTTVAYCGVYPTVHQSRGIIFQSLFQDFFIRLFDVHVFTALLLSPS